MIGSQWWRVNAAHEQWLDPSRVIQLGVQPTTAPPGDPWIVSATVFGAAGTGGVTIEIRLKGDYDTEADANEACRLLLIGQVPADWL